MSFEFEIDVQVDLGGGYRLLAGGFRGTGSATEPSDYAAGATRSSSTRQVILSVLADALDRADMREEQAIELSIVPEPGGRPSRSARQEDVVVLEAPDLGEGRAQVVMLTDEDGGISFHYPVESTADQTLQPPSVRGAGGTKTFVIPAEVPPIEPDTEQTRGLVGLVSSKILQVLSFPVARLVGEHLGEPLARAWESSNRPYGLRWFTPDDYRNRTADEIGEDDWGQLHGRRSLLFVHGTFSTATGGFGAIPKRVMQDLSDRYEGRVIAFNHPSISASPVENGRWLADQIPDGVELDLDIVAHSRGGLVARVLARDHDPDSPLDLDGVEVSSIVCAGTPNYGTPLADAEHLSALCDRLATATNLIPGLPAGEMIDAVLFVVQLIAQAALEGLSGLAVMRPGSEFLVTANAVTPDETAYFGIAADYEPSATGMKRVVEGLKDGAIDYVFGRKLNDLVVPTEGVYRGDGRFAIAGNDVVSFGPERGVFHATFWKEPEVESAFSRWLTG